MADALFKRVCEYVLNRGRLSKNAENSDLPVQARFADIRVYLSDNEKGKLLPSGVSFTLFDQEFVFLPNGRLTVAVIDEDEVDYYDLTENDMKEQVRKFLSWRVEMAENFDI